MIQYERSQQILEALREAEGQERLMTLQELQEKLRTSRSTVRRDLNTLANEGEIVLLRGGGVKLKTGSHETPYNSRKLINIHEKEKIARYAANLVKDGETIYLDAGTTVNCMCKYLKNKHITIVTTSASITKEMQEPTIKCIIVGGELLWTTESMVGPMTDQELSRLYFDKAFIGVSGFSAEAGFSTPDPREARKKQIVRRNARETYVLADSTKSGKITMCKIFDLDEVKVICDNLTPVLEESENCILAVETV